LFANVKEAHPNDDILTWSIERFDQHQPAQNQIAASELNILVQLLGFK